MLLLVWLLILMMMMMMMKSDAAPAEVITARSGEAVLLTSGLPEAGLKQVQDVRWTHPHLVISLKNNMTTCHHGRCELLSDGSLRFSRVQTADAGNYRLQMFDQRGNRLKTKDFLLRVDDSSSSSSSSNVLVPVMMCCFFLLLLFFIIFFILMRRRRRSQRTTTGLLQDVYVVMHGHHGNKKKEEEKQEREEESHYVPCDPVFAMETPITQQMSADVEDVYV